MSLTPKLVTASYRLLTGRAPSEAEASKIIDLIGSRQEFVAFLVLRDKVFDAYPAVWDALTDAAKRSDAAVLAPDAPPIDREGGRERALLVHSAVVNLIAGEKAHLPAANTLDDALRQMAKSSESDVRHFGYHALVARETRPYDRTFGQESTQLGPTSFVLPASSFACRNVVNRQVDAVVCRCEQRREHLVYGPYVKLAAGTYTCVFQIDVDDLRNAPGASLSFEFVSAQRVVKRSVRRLWPSKPSSEVRLSFKHKNPDDLVEFRIFTTGRSTGNLIFRGIRFTSILSLRDIAFHLKSRLASKF